MCANDVLSNQTASCLVLSDHENYYSLLFTL